MSAPIHIGIMQKIGGEYEPIYLDKQQTTMGVEALAPSKTVAIFFNPVFGPGTMYSNAEAMVYHVDFSNGNQQTITYGPDGTWHRQ